MEGLDRLRVRARSVHPAAWLVGVGVIFFAVLFGWLGVRHHRNFGTWSFDMGIYDQAFWLVSRGGQTFMTVRGLEFWGHHLNLIVIAFVPFYWLGAGPAFLYVAQATVMGLAAVPVYLLARDRFLSPWLGSFFAFVFLMYAPIQWIVWANFHPEALVVAPMLMAWWCARTDRWRWFSFFLVLALSTREDTALAVIMLGVVMMVSERRSLLAVVKARGLSVLDAVSRRRSLAALATVVGGIVWYLVATRLVIPHFNRGREPFYVRAYYGNYGDTTFEVLGEVVRHPNRVVSDATQPDRIRFYRDLLLPFGLTPLLAPLQLLVAAPQMLASVIGLSPYARQIRWQYTSVMIAPLTVAMIDGARNLWRFRRIRVALIVFLAASSIISNIAWSNSPWSDNDAVWSTPNDRVTVLRRAVDLVPDDVSVTATYSLLPHLTHREQIYDWPNPWVPSYWGEDDGYRLPDPSEIEWIVVDRRQVGTAETSLFESLIAPEGDFEVVFDQDDVVVARRSG